MWLVPRIGARRRSLNLSQVALVRQRCPTSTVSNRIKAVGEGLWDSLATWPALQGTLEDTYGQHTA